MGILDDPRNQWEFRDVSLVAQTKCQEILPLFSDHLTSLQGRIDHYFSTLSIEDYDWVRNPFLEILSREGIFTLREEEELTDIRHDKTLKLKHRDSNLDSFWVSIENEYPTIAIKAIKILLLFSTTYLCELGFSSLTNIKRSKGNASYLLKKKCECAYSLSDHE